MSDISGPVLLVGCGKMGGALLGGWIASGLQPDDVAVVEPAEALAQSARDEHGVAVYGTLDDMAPGFAPQVVVLAVKPQVMDDVVPPYGRFAGPGTVFLSIAAGKSIAYLESRLGQNAAIVRSMPNTPAAVGRGIAVLCANQATDQTKAEACRTMLAAVGEAVVVDDESLLDAVTAVSGSGPAYVFLLIECLAQAGIEAGLPAELSQRLALATVAGSGALAAQADEPAAVLRQNVTSPGGTTHAALGVLMAEDGLQQLMTRAVAAATQRSVALAD
ncbi:MAG: pyrroline-5-carboxylate reductase [Alphaproteobacteria bacterium]